MGAGLVLLELEDQGDIGRLKQNHHLRWNSMFKNVKRWSPQKVAVRRTVWLNVFGIPFNAWDEPLFKLLGSNFKAFQDFHEETIERRRFDLARIKVITERK